MNSSRQYGIKNLAVYMWFCVSLFSPLFGYQQQGIEIETQGSFVSKADQKKIASLLATNPAALMSDIDFAVEAKLRQKKRSLKLIYWKNCKR